MTTAHKFAIRTAHDLEWLEVTTHYSLDEMATALRSRDLDCGFVGEFLDALFTRGVECEYSEFVSLTNDVLVFAAQYYDVFGDLRTIKIHVMSA